MKERNETSANCKVVNHETEHRCTTINSEPKFDSPQCETRFRRALRGVPSKAFIKQEELRSILCLRPFNLLQLGAAVNREGLEQCRATRKILQFLDKNKEEFLRFEHSSKC